MRKALLAPLALLTAFGISSCAEPVRTGTVAEKSYEEAHSETRTHDVYKYDCGYYKKSAIDITKKYGCGMGYFEEDYEAAIRSVASSL